MSVLRRLWPAGGRRDRLVGKPEEARPAPAAQSQKQQRATLLELLPRLSVGAEIGVHLGDFSAEILKIVAPARLHLVDPWKHFDTPAYKHAWYGGGAKVARTKWTRGTNLCSCDSGPNRADWPLYKNFVRPLAVAAPFGSQPLYKEFYFVRPLAVAAPKAL